MERFEDLITSNIPVLVDFFAEWCGPCKAMKPILEELKGIKGEKVRIVKVDVDKHKEIAAYYQIQSVPTLMIFKDGKQLWRQSGVMRANDLSTIRHYKIFCVNGNTGFRNESRIFYFIHLQNEEAYERKESSSA